METAMVVRQAFVCKGTINRVEMYVQRKPIIDGDELGGLPARQQQQRAVCNRGVFILLRGVVVTLHAARNTQDTITHNRTCHKLCYTHHGNLSCTHTCRIYSTPLRHMHCVTCRNSCSTKQRRLHGTQPVPPLTPSHPIHDVLHMRASNFNPISYVGKLRALKASAKQLQN